MQEKILTGLSAISPPAAEFVREFGASVLWNSEQEDSGDCVVKSVYEDMGILFASLSQDAPAVAREITENALLAMTTEDRLSERCFNCRGDDLVSRELAAKFGFQLEMAGFFMERPGLPATGKGMPDLKPWQREDMEDWLILMIESYRELSVSNAWDPEAICINREAFSRDMEERAKRSEAWSLFQNGRLVAGYRLSGAFIEDLVVLPEFQNQGLGTAILHEAIRQVKKNGHLQVYLRVAEANTGALRLYQREGFRVSGCFAEHGFRKPGL